MQSPKKRAYRCRWEAMKGHDAQREKISAEILIHTFNPSKSIHLITDAIEEGREERDDGQSRQQTAHEHRRVVCV